MGIEAYHARAQALRNIQTERAALGNAEVLPALAPMATGAPAIPGEFDPSATGLPDPTPSGMARIFHGLQLTFEPLRRSQQAFRETILWAGGKTTTEGFKRRVQGALNGKVRMSTSEFGEILMGKTRWDSMKRTPWVPGWMPEITNPEMGVWGKVKSGQISLADMWSLGAEVWADPFSILALTPPGAGVRFTSALTKVGVPARAIKAGEYLVYPWKAPTKIVSTIFGPRSNSPLAVVNFLRQPEDVLPKVIFDDFVAGSNKWMESVHEAWKMGQGLTKSKLKLASVSDQKIGYALWGGKVALTAEETRLKDTLSQFLTNHFDELASANPGIYDELGLAAGSKITLDQLMPSIAGKQSIPLDIWQSWSVDNLGKVFLGLTAEQAKSKGIRYSLAQMPMDQFSAIESVRDALFVIKKKQWLEPALLTHAPKRGRVGESLAISQASKVQRRYTTDIINAFTGNARGRKQIEFDYALAELWQKLAATPMGGRLEKFSRKMGYGLSKDGLPEVSLSTKLTGLWTGTMVQNILGLRLKSALVNGTQNLNYAVKNGLPATLKGMFTFTGSLLHLNNPAYAALRKEANLLADYKGLFNDETWIATAGQRWSDILMGPFNLMENHIRGTGFHIGIDQWLKKNNTTLTAVMANPALKEKLIQSAHLESLNAAFIYGTLGRAPALSSPLVRPLTTLLSYPYKQSEFLRRTMVQDGSAVARFIGLHGWLIEHANQWAGIAAEDFLGWGFTPMTRSFGGVPLMTSPPMQLLLDTTEGLSAVADGDMKRASQKFEKAKEALPIVLAGPVRFPWLQVREVVGDPLTGRKGLKDMWQSRRKEIGEGFVPIARSEVVKNFLIGRSTTQRFRADLDQRMRKAEKKIDYLYTVRVADWVKALEAHDGNALGKATTALASPMNVEGQNFWPDYDSIDSRITKLYEKKLVSKDILAMRDNQFLAQLFFWSQLELLERVRKSGE